MGTACISKKHAKYEKNSKKNERKSSDLCNTNHCSEIFSEPDSDELPISKEPITKYYKLNPKIIGEGKYGIVRVATLIGEEKTKFAIKSVKKEKIKKHIYLFKRELTIMQQMDHPYVVKFYECFEEEKFFHLVMEYCDGGELLSQISSKTPIPETRAKVLMKNIVTAVDYLHSHGICHRDLKPENFLFKDQSSESVLKLVDFGFSQMIDSNSNTMNSLVGSPLYVAPEVLLKSYNSKCDIWSLGVILYVMLSGKAPFVGKTQSLLFNKIVKGEFAFSAEVWNNVSTEAKELILKMMHKNSKKRPNITTLLSDPWLDSPAKKKVQIIKYNERIRKFQFNNKIKKIAFWMIFGIIDSKEIENASKKYLEDITNRDISFFYYCYFHIDLKKYLTRDMLKLAFDYFDVDKSDLISSEDLKKLFLRLGKRKSNTSIDNLIKVSDKKMNGGIDFEDFCSLIVQ